MSDGVLAEDGKPARAYLRQFDLYRVVAFVGVIAQHAVLWPVPGGSDVGWSLVMVLHATREVFFFLSALVAGYSQLATRRPVVRLWVRRLGAVLVPYLVWTGIYVVYTLESSARPLTAGSTIVHDLLNGYFQLYFLVVLFQFYVVLPGLVWLVRRTRGHHGVVFASSLVLQLAMMTISHYFFWHGGSLHALRAVDLRIITPRYVTSYQLYLVSGVLAADHLGELQRLVERHSARILWGVLAVGVATEGYYALGLEIGNTPGHASDLFQPVAAVWFLAACAGLWALGWRWAERSAARAPTPADRLVTWGADASGGFYLAHVLVLQLIFTGLSHAGLTQPGTWGVATAILFVGTLLVTGALVAVLLRTPLRTVLTGPDRRKERAALPVYPARVRPRAMADAIAPAITR
ncbi:MAG: acyltransferase [Actinomycetota bacterium]|nr:acyltransferase [Actinomycetota bacterium]MDA8316161.1 acyltransferase [Actinomycetota bacterium]